MCAYTGAPYAVAINSCTSALLLAVAYHNPEYVSIPRKTYVGVAQSILNAGALVEFRDELWSGGYQLKSLPVWDYARRFTSGMYQSGDMQCVSFHASKILGDTQGGAILHDNGLADVWLRRARFDGRNEDVPPVDDTFQRGWHCYMSPDVAARLLWRLGSLPEHNEDLPSDNYPDLSLQEVFRA